MKPLTPELERSALPTELLQDGTLDAWQMCQAERCALFSLVEARKPAWAIEIGTANGGSLSALARHSGRVVTLDLDATCRDRLGDSFTNVEFLCGRSQETFPPLLERLAGEHAGLGFVLIDGAHDRESVRQDINHLLKYEPIEPLIVVMHDSFNPQCRKGMQEADWQDSPHVHYVELDFVGGTFHSRPNISRQMWGGLAVAVLLPQPRPGELEISARQELLFSTTRRQSSHVGLDASYSVANLLRAVPRFLKRVSSR